MKKKNLSNSFAYIALVFGAIWLGAYITRLILTYNLFEEDELILKSFIDNTNAGGIFQALSPIVYITSLTYVIFIISFTVFLISAGIKLKESGWLFIIVCIIYFTLPFEIFLMTIDYKLILLYTSKNFDSVASLQLIIERLQLFSSIPVIIILCYLTIPYFLIFKPLTSVSKK